MDLPSLDLNLLVALNALLTERNVTRAGERIGLSQPAMSAALARLRRHFGDELLERVGTQYQLTTLAMALVDQSEIALRYVEQTFAARPLFDAAESEREFTIVASDYALSVVGGRLAGLLQERAPDVRLRFRNMDQPSVDHAFETLREFDAMLLPNGYLTDLPSRFLFEDEWVIVGARRPGMPPRQLDLAALSAARWVITFDRPTQFTPPDKTMNLLGIDRRIDIVVDNFTTVPALVAGCDRLALLPRLLVEHHLVLDDIELIEVPVRLPRLTENVWWHPSHASDPGHRWLIQLIIEAAADVRRLVCDPRDEHVDSLAADPPTPDSPVPDPPAPDSAPEPMPEPAPTG